MSTRTAKIVLATSLMFNVFVLGAAAGAWCWPWISAAMQRADPGLAAVADGLDASQQEAFRQILAKARQDVRSDSKAARDARNELAQLMSQPELDRNAINAALETARTADVRVRAQIEAAVVDFAASLDPKARAVLIEGLASRGQIVPRETKK